ncbi:UNVERIFIED_ORG: 5'-deoxynucleotidase YfbR-like HD superfamily hydrolase [Methylobacterium sp. SuP10 SLI 274]|uniref:HD family hydrolase n=1 Tax=Methylorubrum extorquens TaxID=408 RepID=UPI0020A03C9B|nr:HD family hydrolase [Methylorubrum extorquens]MDF9791603.1 5'-deoxynucleotidase YfbR-like HD superfamily hydrolase [Methylorubrum extorquens]MDF9863292.1 5'-deoxynucleotidase YfbR-like HD superfamily hydrolase [Methylorubrum pseudosasae]MDH6636902.1 5'-deoxynucleotidase YfbR-like HD superfamily hydrolase [Methylobacterium sp. SuP10 SLI 274]MDH6666079.1 5'-deoxynucleotidase YfbR-like HD superfamily hydrolase [Methylorubrum zatmanii]
MSVAASTSKKPVRAWQRMLSGRRLDLLDPSPLDVEITDIAHGLARVARWNGQTAGPHVFSVAQHSLLVEAIGGGLDPRIGGPERLELLLHDAPEYVIGDIISPLKNAIGDAYRSVERRLLAAIRQRFGLAAPSPALARLVKRADRIAAAIEATRLAGFSSAEADGIFGRPPVLPDPVSAEIELLVAGWPTAEAEACYLARFAALQRGA